MKQEQETLKKAGKKRGNLEIIKAETNKEAQKQVLMAYCIVQFVVDNLFNLNNILIFFLFLSVISN